MRSNSTLSGKKAAFAALCCAFTEYILLRTGSNGPSGKSICILEHLLKWGRKNAFQGQVTSFFEQNSLCRIKMPFVPSVNTWQCGDLNNKWLTAGPCITGLQSYRNAVKSSISGHCLVLTESTRKCFTKVPETANIQADSFFQPFSLPGKSRRSLNALVPCCS